jgi:hypothetical protein
MTEGEMEYEPQCMPNALFACTSLKISTASEGELCKQLHMLLGEYALSEYERLVNVPGSFSQVYLG